MNSVPEQVALRLLTKLAYVWQGVAPDDCVLSSTPIRLADLPPHLARGVYEHRGKFYRSNQYDEVILETWGVVMEPYTETNLDLNDIRQEICRERQERVTIRVPTLILDQREMLCDHIREGQPRCEHGAICKRSKRWDKVRCPAGLDWHIVGARVSLQNFFLVYDEEGSSGTMHRILEMPCGAFLPTKGLENALTMGDQTFHQLCSFWGRGGKNPTCPFWSNCTFLHADPDAIQAYCRSVQCDSQHGRNAHCPYAHTH